MPVVWGGRKTVQQKSAARRRLYVRDRMCVAAGARAGGECREAARRWCVLPQYMRVVVCVGCGV